MMKVARRFKFDAAHYLPNYAGKCKNLHGHTWHLEVTLQGNVLNTGFVYDFSELKNVVEKEILNLLDHKCLNDVALPFSVNPTCENIILWMWNVLERSFKSPFRRLYGLRLYEDMDSNSYAELP
jgi:6-pyruvoyltetrahydropterin/6-carboxytetrahydropterin synthase